jgi:hypothetical protein
MTFPRESKQKFTLLAALILIFSILSSLSCGGNQTETNANTAANANQTSTDANAKNAAASSDDVAALSSQVLLAILPEEVAFREENGKNAGEKKLIAVLKYSEEDAKTVVAQAEKHRPAESVELGSEDWFPAELTAQTPLSGNKMLKGNAFAPNDFLQMPYKNGRLIKIENSNYFILEVATF